MQNQQVRVNLNDAEPFVCPECGHDIFVEKLKFRVLSALMSPTGQRTPVPMAGLFCDNCDTVVDPRKEPETKIDLCTT